MVFVKLDDLSEDFLDENIKGTGAPKKLGDGMELVWDLEEDNFRIFNHNTVIDKPKAVRIEDF